jgi:hypothetical protein
MRDFINSSLQFDWIWQRPAAATALREGLSKIGPLLIEECADGRNRGNRLRLSSISQW